MLQAFVAAAQQDHQRLSVFSEIHAVTAAGIHTQFRNAFANRFAVTEIARRYAPQANLDLRPRPDIAQAA